MAEKPLILQDYFLNSLRKSKSPATIFLVKGVKLQGAVTWFDPFSLLLRREGSSQLVYKHAISTIMPQRPLDGFAEGAAALPTGDGARKSSLQDVFLSAAARDGGSLTLFLVNGVMLQGSIAAFDQFSVLLQREDQFQLVYKHAISTLQPQHALDLGEGGPEPPEEPQA